MNDFAFQFQGTQLIARPSGCLWWPEAGLLCVSDLHFGKSERIARRAGTLLPPYETRDTLVRLQDELEKTRAASVVCLGDSFDDLLAAEDLASDVTLWLNRLCAGRDWTWIEGNHDPGPVDLPGTHRAELTLGPLVFRHISDATATGEISGHYHPKARVSLRGTSAVRPCFLIDTVRIVLPAFGTYTGGMASTDPLLCGLMDDGALAVLTGKRALPVSMPRPKKARRRV